MIKLAIGLCALSFAHSEPLDVRFPGLPIYSKELEAALSNFKSEVKFVINEAHMVESEYIKLLETLHNSATYLQKKVSDSVNHTMTEFNKDVNHLLTDAKIDVSKCMAFRFTIDSTMTDILIKTNTCVHDKLNQAQVYTEKSILSIEYMLELLKSLEDIADDDFSETMKTKDIKTVFRKKIFLESPNNVASRMLSTLTKTTLVISRIDQLMISDCVSTEALSSLVDDTRFVYSKIATCIADLNDTDAEL